MRKKKNKLPSASIITDDVMVAAAREIFGEEIGENFRKIKAFCELYQIVPAKDRDTLISTFKTLV